MDLIVLHTVFENHRKSFIQHYERSELLILLVDKNWLKTPKNVNFGNFLKTWSFEVKQSQLVMPWIFTTFGWFEINFLATCYSIFSARKFKYVVVWLDTRSNALFHNCAVEFVLTVTVLSFPLLFLFLEKWLKFL